MTPVLRVTDLQVRYQTGRGVARAIDGVSFSVDTGECLGLVGESGSGKSTIAKAILGILPSNGEVTGGKIVLGGRDLRAMSRSELQKVRWKEISLVPQSAMSGFDPVFTVQSQIEEAIRFHPGALTGPWQPRMELMFDRVGLARSRLKNYPHQFSGGMRQRAMIAMAMVLDPALIVADEPTTGLDVIVQDQIMRRLKQMQEESRKAMLLITHDMAVVAENCNKIAVVYAGRIVEYGTDAVFRTPRHPYTMGLCNAFPDLEDGGRALISIPGSPPDLVQPPRGCRFQPRCPFATALCAEVDPPLRELESGHFAACHYAEQSVELSALARAPETWRTRLPLA